ncbi:uncharacterized protein F4812DRAFT_455833 [Daldinia caldariorum]|uniref:uncharacterized protein n=1 Tax=Daldinia caldariorum TaxID=326644 RepID=UPI002008058C|nr:uncharacterized protein F4812DRAFT_455833 [Daldinia caldariorum]KAI1471725.1 hypothetical protein F4812DRAFT_455833 [Daldinia caldariorum]
MQFSTLAFLVGAIIGAPLALASAEPASQATTPQSKVFYNFCCMPGCYYCEAKDCPPETCSGVFSSCCGESFRKATGDGNLQFFNAKGQKIHFVSGDFTPGDATDAPTSTSTSASA